MDVFKEDGAHQAIGDMTIENSASTVLLHGSLDLTRDKRGLADARALAQILNAAVAALEEAEARNDLPAVLPDLPPVIRRGPLFPR